LSAPGIVSVVNALMSGFTAAGVTLGAVQYTLTEAERQGLVANPVVVVPGIAGRYHVPIAQLNQRTTGAAGAGAPGRAVIRWRGQSSPNLTTSFQLCSTATGRNDFDYVVTAGATGNLALIAPATILGSGLVAAGTANQSGGAGSTFRAWLVYLTVTP